MGDGPVQQQDQVSLSSSFRSSDRAQCRLLRYEPGASFPLHRHDFAQVWYILEGEFCCGGRTYGPGTFVYMPDPHFEHEMTTESGGTVVFLQYPGPTTGARPTYDGRMNLKKPESSHEHDLNR